MDSDDELRPVRRHHRHTVALPDAATREILRQRVGRAVEFPVGPAIVAGQDRHMIGKFLGDRFEPVMHEARCHWETFFSELRFGVNTQEV